MRRVYVLYALSGFVSLGYQVAWFRIYVDRFGSTNLTFALVVCNFIAGLGLGALLSARLARRLGALLGVRDRLRLYGVVELLVTATVLLTAATGAVPAELWGRFPYHDAGGVYEPNLSYALSQLALAVLCVFLPCLFMGVTFPLLCDAFRLVRGAERFPSSLYAWNTLGACTGVLACLFLLLPRLGHERMLWLLAGLNLGLGVFFVARGGAPAPDLPEPEPGPRPAAGRTGLLLTAAVLSGLLAGALEGDMFKRIDFISSGNSTVMALISFWAILGIFLASWAVSAVPSMSLDRIKVAWVAGFGLYLAAWLLESPIRKVFWMLETDVHTGGPGQVGYYGFVNSLGHCLLFVGVFVGPAYFCVSLLLPYVCNRIHADRRHLGLAYGLNTLAFCVGLVGFTLVAPGVSIFYSLKLLMVLFAVAVALLLVIRESGALAWWKPAAAAAVFAAACLVVPRGFDRDYAVPGSLAARFPVRALKSNGAHTTYVVEAPRGDFLFFERHAMSGTSLPESTYMRLMAHVPLLAHPEPRRALLICFGVGHTASAIATHDTIEAIDVVELNRKVIDTAPEFAEATGAVHDDPRLTFIADDGRRFLGLTDRVYDLITSEPPPPMQAGVYRLYTREYYRQALARLGPRGLMTQWIPSYQMPGEAVELAIRTFIDVFPHALLFTGRRREFILMGSPAPIDVGLLERRFHEQPAVTADLRRMGITRPLSLIGRIVLGDGALRRRFGEGRIISDARNDLEFVFHDPDRSGVIPYSPYELLTDLEAHRLECGTDLGRVLTHLGRLRYHVREYPITTLRTARDVGPPGVRLADVDWAEVDRILDRAADLRAEGDLDGILGTLREALDLAPEQPGVLLRVAAVQLSRGRPLAAVETLREFQRIEPDDEAGHRMLGQALWRQGRTAEAIAAMRRAVEADPRSADAHHTLGISLVREGELDEGIAHLERALAIQPGRPQTRRALNMALSRRGSG